MFELNLHFSQIARLELYDIKYVMHGRNADGVTFKVELPNEQEYTRALEILIRS